MHVLALRCALNRKISSVPSFFSPSFLPAAELANPVPRHIGFLNANRRALALGAIAACGLLTSIQSLPANAEIVLAEAEQSVPMQRFTSPNIVQLPVVRDGFGVTMYSVVQWPVPSTTTITSGFGYRWCAGCTTDHTGIDFTPGDGFPVQAIANGVVTAAGYAADYGVNVTVQHEIDGQIVSSLYAHMQEGSMNLSIGDIVARGDLLGLVGDSGLSTGAHLHLAIIIGDAMVDPHGWLLAHANA